MAAGGTRHQAELQGMNEHDIVSLGAPGGRIAEAMQRDNARRDFDQLPDCYPIFCLTENIPKTVSYQSTVVSTTRRMRQRKG